MDLNYLYFRHQLSLMKAAIAGCVEARASHRGLADLYAAKIDALRHGRPAGDARPYILSGRRDCPAAASTGSLSNVTRA